MNIFQFQYQDNEELTNGETVTDILTIVESIYALLVAALTTLPVFRDIRIANKTQGTILGTFGWPTLIAGTNADQPVAPGVCFLTSWNTPIPRVGMRKYWGVMTEANTDADGTWSAGLVAVGVTVAALLSGPLQGPVGGYFFGYLSPKTLGFEVPAGAVVTDIPAYQRRRRQGRGS
jgi:ABC-type glycerol-3-phosphate transport system permease component